MNLQTNESYAGFLANEASLISTMTISEKCTEKLVEELSTITFADIEAFKNDLLAKDGKPMVVSVAARPEVSDESISDAVEAFHRILSPKFYEDGAEYGEEHLPRESKPSKEFAVNSGGQYLIKQLNKLKIS